MRNLLKNHFNKTLILLLLGIQLLSSKSFAFENCKKDSLNKKELLINTSFISAAAITYTGLYQLWYKNYPQTSFQYFNDLHEWKYMDKAGHICTAYHLNRTGYNLLEHYKINKPLLKSSIYSFTYMTGIEVFDGFSKNWGFSWYDIISNGIGTLIFASQENYLKKQLLKVKFSSHMTSIASCRPNLLGNNKIERIFKDYNGQTYWLTLNLNQTFNEKFKLFKFIDLALGYSIDGFTGARDNSTYNCTDCYLDCENLSRTSSIMMSLDLNLNSFKGRNKFLDVLIQSLSIIKLPAPTFIMDKNPEFKLLYF